MKVKYDCWQAHSIYYMCGVGIAHLSHVMKEQNALNVVPGQMEALILMSSLTPKVHPTGKCVCVCVCVLMSSLILIPWLSH